MEVLPGTAGETDGLEFRIRNLYKGFRYGISDCRPEKRNVMYKFYPEPVSVQIHEGILNPVSSFDTVIEDSILSQCQQAGFSITSSIEGLCTGGDGFGDVCRFYVNKKGDIHKEGYRLVVGSSGITMDVADGAGLYYGLQTLQQLWNQCGGRLPFLEIDDYPALELRGIMLDIGRNKIPSMETMYALLDKLSAMRINHVQFYMEGYCYQYKKYPYLFTNDTPVNGEEFRALDQYAKSRFIDLVPNQNVLGHMDQWLATPQLNPLAECEDGFIFENLFWRPPMTLDVNDPKSLAFVTDMLDDLLENFTSPLLNVNMDEPFELGQGKNQKEAQESGKASLYLGYARKINDYCKSKNRRMMMWGDQVLENPASVEALPKDIILLDWIYEGDAHFETHAQLMQRTGLDYCLCPGSSSWGSITGRSDNMRKNIKDAADCAVRYGGKGIITTDWGDLGHWQYISCSYPAFSLTGLYGWSGSGADEGTALWYCNQYLYKDESGSAYQTAYDLGNYYHYENAPLYNTTLSFAVMSSKYTFDSLDEFDSKIQRLLTLSANIARTNHIPPKEPVIAPDYQGLWGYLDDLEKRIDSLRPHCEDGPLIKDEMRNGIRMIRHGSMLYYSLTEHRQEKELLKEDLMNLYEQLDSLLEEHYRLWMARNRRGGFDKSSAHMLHLLRFYQKMLKELS